MKFTWERLRVDDCWSVQTEYRQLHLKTGFSGHKQKAAINSVRVVCKCLAKMAVFGLTPVALLSPTLCLHTHILMYLKLGMNLKKPLVQSLLTHKGSTGEQYTCIVHHSLICPYETWKVCNAALKLVLLIRWTNCCIEMVHSETELKVMNHMYLYTPSWHSELKFPNLISYMLWTIQI